MGEVELHAPVIHRAALVDLEPFRELQFERGFRIHRPSHEVHLDIMLLHQRLQTREDVGSELGVEEEEAFQASRFKAQDPSFKKHWA